MVSHPHQEEFHKFKSHLKLMKMVSWTLVPLIKEHPKMPKLPLQTIKEDFQKNKLKILLNKLKDLKIKIKKSEKEFKLKTD